MEGESTALAVHLFEDMERSFFSLTCFADLQAQCLCLRISRLPNGVKLGVELYPFINIHGCCRGFWANIAWVDVTGPQWTCALYGPTFLVCRPTCRQLEHTLSKG